MDRFVLPLLLIILIGWVVISLVGTAKDAAETAIETSITSTMTDISASNFTK